MILLVALGILLGLSVVYCFYLIQLATESRLFASQKQGLHDLLQLFQTEIHQKELLPVIADKLSNWTLSLDEKHRTVVSQTWNGHYLTGVASRVKCSQKNLSTMLRDPAATKCWRPSIGQHHLAHTLSGSSSQMLICSSSLPRHASLVSWLFEPLFMKDCFEIKRYMKSYTDIESIVEYNSRYGDTTVFILQPILGREHDQSLLSIITDGHIERALHELTCIEEYYLARRSPVVKEAETLAEPNPEAPPESQRDTENGEEGEESHKLDGDTVTLLAHPCDSRPSDLPLAFTTGPPSPVPSTPDSAAVSMQQPHIHRSLSTPLIVNQSVTPRRNPLNKAQSETVVEHPPSPIEAPPIEPIDSNNSTHIDYRTLANQCAADLLSSVIAASNMIQRPKDKSESLPFGWIFDSTERDVAILLKNGPNNQITSWLGKAMIRANPDEVWKALNNPYIRYITDGEILKDLEVLYDLPNEMKIVKLHYQVSSQILWAETREFIVLQAAKQERKKRILTLCSIEWPEHDGKTPRGKFNSTGWIVEPVPSKKSDKIYSMVTYISSIGLGETDLPGKQAFEEELCSRQPLAVAELRDYLMHNTQD